jgi:hypothetical protein
MSFNLDFMALKQIEFFIGEFFMVVSLYTKKFMANFPLKSIFFCPLLHCGVMMNGCNANYICVNTSINRQFHPS